MQLFCKHSYSNLQTMKTGWILFGILIATSGTVAQTTYYVSLQGDDSHSGLSEAQAWRTISYAASSESPVGPGDTVYIKAGDYGDEYVVFETSGAPGAPIVFEGYRETPGDQPDLNWAYGINMETDASVMPLLDGADRTTGTALDMEERQYLEIRNFQIKNYEVGIYAPYAHHLLLENIIGMYFGDQTAEYDGRGIALGPSASHNDLFNCTIYNACAEGISIEGNKHYLQNCKAYSDDYQHGDEGAMDYYIHIAGNENTLVGCYVERVGDLPHVGHGIDLKTDCENNLLLNCISKGMKYDGFELRHRGVKYNILESCIAIGCGYGIRDGASFNQIKNCKSQNAVYAIMFYDTSEDGGAQYAGKHNVFENCIFENATDAVINFLAYEEVSPADSNTFVNCLFYGGDYLFNCDRENNDNAMINCIVANVDNYYRTAYDQDEEYPLNFSFAYSDFWDNGFSAPTGTNLLTSDPQFADADNHDYHLQPGSPCIDAGTSEGAPLFDFEGHERPQGNGIDIGPYEYTTSSGIFDEHAADGSIRLYPNPCTEVLFAACPNVEFPAIEIFDVLGRRYTSYVHKTQLDKTTIRLDLSGLKRGAYIIKAGGFARRIYKW